MQKKWDKAKIIAKILILHDQGQDLSSKKISKEYPALYSASSAYFNSWQKAIEAAGLNYAEIRKNKKWTKKKIIQNILLEPKENLSTTRIIKKNYPLFGAAVNHFNSWEKAIETAGLNYNKIKVKEVLTEEKIIHEILSRYDNDLGLDHTSIYKENRKLFEAALRRFKNWQNAIESAGLDYSQIKRLSYWSKEKIIEKIMFRKNNNLPLSAQEVIKTDEKLYSSTLRHFNSWSEAVHASGLNYNEEARFVKSKTRLKLMGRKRLKEIRAKFVD